MRRFIAFLTLALLLVSAPHVMAQSKVQLIFDTDMGPDYDDVGAITLVHALADSGQVDILGTIASTKYEGVAAVLSVLNTYFGRPDIPIGIPREKAVEQRDHQHWSDTLIARYPHKIKRNSEASEAVALYRRLLSSQANSSVTVVTIGFLTNISDLLLSAGDQYSKLSGVELVRAKVKKLVCMAGVFPAGNEFNIREDAAAAKQVFEICPVPIILSGFEIGQKIKSGLPLIRNAAIQHSPVKDVFKISIPMAKADSAGRMSWDQTAVLIAIKGHEPFYDLRQGTIAVSNDGSNSWSNNGTKHAYVIEKMDARLVEGYINKLMQHQPNRKLKR